MSEWDRQVGQSEYRVAEPADIIGARIMNADVDTLFLQKGEQKFLVYLNGQNNPIDEYRERRGS